MPLMSHSQLRNGELAGAGSQSRTISQQETSPTHRSQTPKEEEKDAEKVSSDSLNFHPHQAFTVISFIVHDSLC